MPNAGKFHTIGKAPYAGQDAAQRTGERFDVALAWLRTGRKVTRGGWNGMGMYCYFVPERSVIVEGSNEETRALVSILGEGGEIERPAQIDMRYGDGKFGVWTPTIEDILADDWALVM